MNEKQIKALIDQLSNYNFVHAEIKIDDFELKLDRDELVTGKISKDEITINSPMIGIFHTSGQDIKVGSVIKEHMVVGQVESMKLFNDIVAKTAGRVSAVLCQDGQAVEFDQPLFKVVQGAVE